jgi:hypothetical protein
MADSDTTEIADSIELACRCDDRAFEIFENAMRFERPFKECIGEIYMTGLRAGLEQR